MYSFNPSIVCVTETWLSDSIYDSEILSVGYVLYRKDRPSRGGGVLIAISDSLFSCLIPSPPELEIVSVKIGQNNDTVICCIYLPPESPLSCVSSLVHFLTELTSSFSKCIFVGDFNFPDIDWTVLMGSTSQSNCFCNFIFDCNLSQHVLEPTHVRGNHLDLIISSASVDVYHVTVHPLSVVNFSDHHVISFDFYCHASSLPDSTPGFVFDFCKADYGNILSFLLESDFSAVFGSSDIEFVWSFIKSFIYEAMLLYIPRMLVKRRQGPKWFNSDVRHQQKCLRTLKRKFNIHPTQERKNKILKMERLLQSKLVQAKSDYETKLIESHNSSNSSAIYSYIRSISNQSVIPPTLHLDNIVAVSDSDKASLFNGYFHSVFTRSSFQLPPSRELETPPSILSDIAISELDVFRALRSLDVTKAKGCDGISPKLLRHCALALYQPLYHLFSLSLSQHFLPADWRTHLIKPVFKSGDKTFIRNYRPISLLPVVSKVLEKLVFSNIVDFVTSSLSLFQFGFLRGRSTLQQLLIFFNILFSCPSQSDVIYLDFRKAFDSVAHNELLYKIWKFGIAGNLWLWLRAYLTNRVQFVSIGQSSSSTLPVISGVPQGSILGPVLFLIFINDLPTALLFAKVLLFADDAKCIMPISSLQDCMNLQSDLSRLTEWCSTWNLFLNEDKCSAFHFKTRLSQISFNYLINGKVISSKAVVKDLSLTISADLSWRPHYRSISSKAYIMLGLLRRVFSNCVSVSGKCSLYISLVRSRLLYLSPVWHPYLLMDIKCLELVKRRSTKFITSNPLLDYKTRLINLDLLPLMMEFEIADILFLVKSLKSPSDNFNINEHLQFCSHPTRACYNFKLKQPLCKSDFEQSFYFNRIPRLWNSLPPLDINLPISVIKLKLRQYFRDHFISNFISDNICTYHYLCPCSKCSKLPVKMHFGMSPL